MRDKIKRKNKIIFLYKALLNVINFLRGFRKNLNQWMFNKYSPKRIGLMAASAVTLLWFIMLFIPPYMGVADDGSLDNVLIRNGLSYMLDDPEGNYNNYYVREYRIQSDTSNNQIKNSQDILIQLAIFLDQLFTHDNIFDLRFLAILYGILYFPAVYYIVKNACFQIKNFSEAAVVGILAVIIFGDISYLTYFASFYPEPLWMLCLMVCMGQICNIIRKKSGYSSLLLLALAGMIIAVSRRQCFIIGFIIAGFFIRSIFINKKMSWILVCICLSVILSFTGMFSLYSLDSDYNITSKFHSMTRGILFQAKNPEKALKEFGINPSYSVLAKISAYNSYPFILPDSNQLKVGFYDNYNSYDIAMYYLRHPISLIGMLNVAVKSTTNLHRDYCGNYEKSYGMPKMAQGVFWSGWSNFKTRSAPKTIGYLLLLNILAYSITRRNDKINYLSGKTIKIKLTDISFVLTATALSQAVITIIMSGDSQLKQHAFLLGASSDLFTYFIIASALSGLKLFEDDNHGK